MSTNKHNLLLDLIAQERERRVADPNRIKFLLPGWTESEEQYAARIAALRAAGEIDDRTRIVRPFKWHEPPFLHEMEAVREKQRRDAERANALPGSAWFSDTR